MDRGIDGRRALVCAASKGFGRACAEALACEGVHVTITGRNRERLAQTAAEIEKLSSVPISLAAGDIAHPEVAGKPPKIQSLRYDLDGSGGERRT